MTGIPLVSTIIPTYDRWPRVGEAVRSVIGQTFDDGECIVIDDGSTDETFEQLSGIHPKVQVIRQENKGVSAARNRGIELATGEWLAFLDSDDLWHPTKLGRQMEYL